MNHKLSRIAVLIFTLGTAAAATYTVTDLGTLVTSPPDTSSAASINTSGQVAGASGGVYLLNPQICAHVPPCIYYGTDQEAFLYSNGALQNLTTGAVFGMATAINDTGQIAGSAAYGSTSNPPTAFLYSGGVAQTLGGLRGGNNYSQAWGLNGSAQVVGQAYTCNPGCVYHAFLFSGNGPMQDLGSLKGFDGNSIAYAINASGQITGNSDASDGLTHAFLYSGNGPMQDLGPGLPGCTSSYAFGINTSGQIVGTCVFTNSSGGSSNLAFLYSGGAYQNLGSNATAYGINDNGVVVGYSVTSAGIKHGFIYSGRTLVDLNNIITTPGVTMMVAYSINASGQIAGYGTTASDPVFYHALLLNPKP